VAGALGITDRTVKAHVAALLQKFEVGNRTELALVASEARLRSPSNEREGRVPSYN
jgi:DNA-binding NarL/FixJ family response regulator